MFNSSQPFTGIGAQTAELVRAKFVKNVYTWMAGGLGVTALTSAMVARSPAFMNALIQNRMLFWVLIIAEFGLVMWLSGFINRMSVQTASWAFLAYSFVNGLTLSVIFLAYSMTAIATAFAVAAGMFASAAIYGTVTRRDLTSIGSLAFMALIGIIIASLVNIFVASRMLDWLISYAGVAIFTALAAYDAQKISNMGISASMAGEAALSRAAIIGALALYLDFINLFLFLLRIFGSSRD